MPVLKKVAVGSIGLSLLMLPPLITPQAAQGEHSEGYSASPRDEYNMQRPSRVKTERLRTIQLDAYVAAKAKIDAALAKLAEERRIYEEQKRAAEAAAKAAAEAAQRRQYQSTHPRVQQNTNQAPAMSGSCAAMAPEGFPDYIVQRESRGDPNAYNSSSGARGCAQILDSHFRSGGSCAGMSYADCWRKLWAGGAGASNWACTPESGCG